MQQDSATRQYINALWEGFVKGTNDEAFNALCVPSGTGKTQLAFALPKDKCTCIYLNISLASEWRRDTKHRRLIEVSCTVAQGKYRPVSLNRFCVEDFTQVLWTLDAYIQAIQNTDFSRSVDKFLDADARLVKKKSYQSFTIQADALGLCSSSRRCKLKN